MNEHDDCTCDEAEGGLPAWKLCWVDPVRWALIGIRTACKAVDRTCELIGDDMVMHGKYLKERDDFAASAGRELEALIADPGTDKD